MCLETHIQFFLILNPLHANNFAINQADTTLFLRPPLHPLLFARLHVFPRKTTSVMFGLNNNEVTYSTIRKKARAALENPIQYR